MGKQNTLLCIYRDDASHAVALCKSGKCYSPEEVVIREFTPADIPAGELCWCWRERDTVFEIELLPFQRFQPNYARDASIAFVAQRQGYDYCVPYLIAGTAEDAETKRDWWK